MRIDSVSAAAVRDDNPCERLAVFDARRQYILTSYYATPLGGVIKQ